MLNELSGTPHGRLLSVAIALGLMGGGIAGTIHDPMGIALMCACLLGSVVLTLVAIALSIESRPAFGVLAAVVLPLLFFLYAVGLQVAIHHRAGWGLYGFAGLGALFAINALRSIKRPEPAAHRRVATAGAH